MTKYNGDCLHIITLTLDDIATELCLDEEHYRLLGEDDWYIGNPFNEVDYVYGTALPICNCIECISGGEVTI